MWRCEEGCDLFHNELVEEPVKTRCVKTMLGPSPDGCHFKGHTIFQVLRPHDLYHVQLCKVVVCPHFIDQRRLREIK